MSSRETFAVYRKLMNLVDQVDINFECISKEQANRAVELLTQVQSCTITIYRSKLHALT